MKQRYYTLNQYFQERFGEKVYKISLNGGMTCPNRDGTCGNRGCIFCSEGGSGDFASSATLSIKEQIKEGKLRLHQKQTGQKFIAYFQAFTNTYAPISYLRHIFYEAIKPDDIVGISIGTRPDCLSKEVLTLLQELNEIKPVFVELGLQTIYEQTATFIRRGYELPCFEEAVYHLKEIGCNVVVHMILGLPNETNAMIINEMRYLNTLPIDGIKLHLLHILKNTDLAIYYEKHPFHIYTLEEYTDLILACINELRPDIVIHRITGDGPKNLLIAPLWSGHKKLVLNTIHHQMKEQDCYQGKLYNKENHFSL
ncbi:MAG: TIGR01212 family radical SAM protein [Firmicutes bacterium]|uniref:TIGR01212 family radical SAM protein n=1 Tax=Candidatus Scybalomonas excrementavium TaxID=2840943 RepID=A0A9D9N6Y5_9FIRM|nr:TIGR01212 family radical SAM protein [Candidatus Scybalomonas excrementavium]